MDPRKQECLSHYGYGAGYGLVGLQVQQAMARRMGVDITIPTLCWACPRRPECRDLVGDPIGSPGSGGLAAYINNHRRGMQDFAARAPSDAEVAALLVVSRSVSG